MSCLSGGVFKCASSTLVIQDPSQWEEIDAHFIEEGIKAVIRPDQQRQEPRSGCGFQKKNQRTEFWTAMSARATRPRSRRGRHAPPVSAPFPAASSSLGSLTPRPGSELGPVGHFQGELDPVVESSEEAEAASGSSELGPVPSQESCKPRLQGPEAEASGQGLGNR